MHTLDTYHLVLNSVVVVMMPLIIWANLRGVGVQNPMNAKLWREHPNFMWSSMAIISLLTVYAAVALLAHFGLVSGQVADFALPAVGIPFLLASVALIWFGVGALRMMIRDWNARQSGD